MPEQEVPTAPVAVERLKRRVDFKAASAGRKFVTPSMVLLARPEPKAGEGCRLGFTVTKKLGNAVVRNRIRRRLKEAARQSFPQGAAPATDYVMIARPPALDRSFESIVGEMRFALGKLARSRP